MSIIPSSRNEMPCALNKLNVDVLSVIGEFSGSLELNKLLLSSPSLYRWHASRLYYWNLTFVSSERVLLALQRSSHRSTLTTNALLSRITHRRTQLSLNLEASQVVDVSAVGSVHTLDLSRCSGVVDVSALGSVHTLDLSWCSGVVDVSALGSVHTLNLMNCVRYFDELDFTD